jgi:hypothetical protein
MGRCLIYILFNYFIFFGINEEICCGEKAKPSYIFFARIIWVKNLNPNRIFSVQDESIKDSD